MDNMRSAPSRRQTSSDRSKEQTTRRWKYGLLAAVLNICAKLASADSSTQDRSLIVGGIEAPIGRYAYSASLSTDGDFDSHLCGGSLIAPDIVLTVAHCVSWPGPYTRADIDQHNLDDPDEKHEYFFAREPVLHPDHVLLPDEFNNDVAVVKLYGMASTPPVKLNRNPSIPTEANDPLTVFGWGFADDDVPANMVPSPVMMEADIDYVPNDVCATMEGIDPKTSRSFSYGDRYVNDGTMCAHHPDRGSCLGDSGGPLIIRGDDATEDVQVGLVSFGLDCNNDVLPGVYTRMSSYIDWITDRVCELSSDPPAEFGCAPPPAPGSIKTFVTVELKLGNWIPYSTGWLLESADGKIIYGYRGTQTYGANFLDQTVTETIAVDTDQEFRFVVLHNDGLGFCCSWYGEGYYRVYQGRGTSGKVLVSGDGDFDTYVKEEMFSIGTPPPAAPTPAPTPMPTPVSGTPFVSVVLNLEFGAEHLAWGIKAADGTREYVDFRSTNTFKGLAGTITEEIFLFPTSEGVEDYEFIIYNVNGGWVGDYEVYMGSVNEGRLLVAGDSAFDRNRVLEKKTFAVLEDDYSLFGTPPPPTPGESTMADGGDSSSGITLSPRGHYLLGLSLSLFVTFWSFGAW